MCIAYDGMGRVHCFAASVIGASDASVTFGAVFRHTEAYNVIMTLSATSRHSEMSSLGPVSPWLYSGWASTT
jgi:hypothetical protein